MNLLVYLAVPSFLSLCFLMTVQTLQTLSMRLANSAPLPDDPLPLPAPIEVTWRGRGRARIHPTQRALGIAHLRVKRPWLQPEPTLALASETRLLRPAFSPRRSVSFKELHRALVFHGFLPSMERPEIPAFAGSLPLLA